VVKKIGELKVLSGTFSDVYSYTLFINDTIEIFTKYYANNFGEIATSSPGVDSIYFSCNYIKKGIREIGSMRPFRNPK